MTNPIEIQNGQATWTHQPTDKYHVTGTLVNGKRFKSVYSNPHQALSINLWNGTVWLVRNNKRFKIRRVIN